MEEKKKKTVKRGKGSRREGKESIFRKRGNRRGKGEV